MTDTRVVVHLKTGEEVVHLKTVLRPVTGHHRERDAQIFFHQFWSYFSSPIQKTPGLLNKENTLDKNTSILFRCISVNRLFTIKLSWKAKLRKSHYDTHASLQLLAETETYISIKLLDFDNDIQRLLMLTE